MSSLNNYSLLYISSLLFSLSSFFYLSGITSVSPVYLLLPFSFVLVIFALVKDKLTKKVELITFYSLSLISCIILLRWNAIDSRYAVNFILGVISFIGVQLYVQNLAIEKVISIARLTIWFFILLATLDAIYRFSNPTELVIDQEYAQEMGLTFYKYKFSSIMFGDSNMVGLICVGMFWLSFYIKYILKYKLSLYTLILLLVLTSLCLSRASLLALLGTFGLLQILKNKKLFLVILPILIVIAVLFSGFFSAGGSFESKFDVWNRVGQYLYERDNVLLYVFGVGMGMSPSEIGMASHNLFLVYLFEGGLITFSLMIIFYLSIILQERRTLYIVFPLFINFMSVGIYAGAPPIFILIGYIFSIETKLRNGVGDVLHF